MPGCTGGGGQLEAHHIEMWATHPELRYEPLNGILLCQRCHLKVTGDETAYIPLFKEIVSKQKLTMKSNRDFKSTRTAYKKAPWRPNNPNMRYGY